MDFSSSFKNLKSHGSYKHSRRISAGGVVDDTHREQQPILSDHHRDSTTDDHNQIIMRSTNSNDLNDDRREVIVKIDGDDYISSNNVMEADHNKIWHETTYDFWKDDERSGNNGNGRGQGFEFQQKRSDVVDDPPSKLIGQFLNKQMASGGEMSLDMDLEMDELRHGHQNNHHNFPPISETENSNHINGKASISKDLRVSFQDPKLNVVDIASEPVEKRYKDKGSSEDDKDEHVQQHHNRRRSSIVPAVNDNNGNGGGGGGEVLRCTSFQKRASMMRMKTKSRLIDPPQPEMRSQRVGKSGPMRSGMLGRASGMLGKLGDDEEDDSLFDEDLPDEFKKAKLNALTLAQWVSLVLIVTALICTLSISKWKEKKLRGLELWKWDVLVLVLICGRLVSEKAVQNCIWLGLVLTAWHSMFDKKVEGSNKFLWFVNRLMVCMLVATLLWLVKTLIIKVLASSFHVSTFFDRIQDSLFNQYVIETLSGPPLIEIHNNEKEEERTMAEVWKLQNAGATVPPDLRAYAFPPTKSGRVIGGGGPLRAPVGGVSLKVSGPISKNQNEGITIDHLHRMNPKNISAWNMKRLVKIVRHGVISTLDEQILDTTQEDESTTQIRSEFEAKVAARKIFQNVARPRSKFIYMQDLMRFLREDEALKTMSVMDGSSESERISKSTLKNWVVNAFRERRALALTLNDTKTAVNKLHHMVNVLVGITIVVICLVILEIATSKFLLFVSSQIVVVAFIFGNTCKTIFEALIFLFVMHPYDVGDRCEIDGVQ
ncbi:unnamed protein product, partial [Ilex paraguariensis]